MRELIQTFHALPKGPGRREFLTSLIGTLSSHEWRFLQGHLNSRSFKFDILSHVPTEIAHQIILSLPPLDVVLLQRVSKRWREILSSSELCRLLLNAHFRPSQIILSKSEWTRFFYSKLACRHALEYGRPYSRATYPFVRDSQIRHTRTAVDYLDGRLCWSQDYGAVYLLDLRTGEQRLLFNETNRESFDVVKLSQYWVGAITPRGVCLVQELATGQTSSFRIPSAMWRSLQFWNDHLLIKNETGDNSLIWDTRAQKLHDFHVSLKGAYLYVEDKYLVRATVKSDPSGRPEQMIFAKFTVSGEKASEESIHLEKPPRAGPERGPEFACGFTTYDRPDKIFCATLLDAFGDARRMHFNVVSSDPQTGLKTSHVIPSFDGAPLIGFEHASVSHNIPGVLYFAAPKRGLRSVMRDVETGRGAGWAFSVLNMNETEPRIRESEISEILNALPRGGVPDPNPLNPITDFLTLGDDEFLVVVLNGSVQVYCFDKDIRLAGENSAYRAERMERATQRIEGLSKQS